MKFRRTPRPTLRPRASVHLGPRRLLEPLEARTLLAATLVGDFNTTPLGSAPEHFAVVNDQLFFTALDHDGPGLWKTDGTAAGHVNLLP